MLEGVEFSEKAFDQAEAVNAKIETNTENHSEFDMNKEEVTTSETVTFFTSLLDLSAGEQKSHSELFDFAKKQATGLYAKGATSVITDLEEFISDVLNT